MNSSHRQYLQEFDALMRNRKERENDPAAVDMLNRLASLLPRVPLLRGQWLEQELAAANGNERSEIPLPAQPPIRDGVPR